MKWRSAAKGALLVTLSALLIAAVALVGMFAFVYYNSSGGRDWDTPPSQLSEALVWDTTQISVSGQALHEPGSWMMLLDEEGRVVWSFEKPDDVPQQYTLSDVAAFTRWYLNDYPVQCWVREDGLLVVGAPKGSVWKHDIAMQTSTLLQTPFWFLGGFLLALGGVLGLAAFAVRRWARQSQQVRDAARSGWINGVSHDIRTPLSVVMGYAAQLEDAPGLAPQQKRKISAIRAQSEVIRDLVNDLNLTMRLDSEMQPLRKETLCPEVFLRQTAADFLNGGMAEGFDFEMQMPETPLPQMEADPFLLRRALNNLLTNSVRHNAPGGAIRLGAKAEHKQLVIWVEGGDEARARPSQEPQAFAPDGGAPHGTGLRLVKQIAAAHGGKAIFYRGTPCRSELVLPLKPSNGRCLLG